jgi:hypothetical protein
MLESLDGASLELPLISGVTGTLHLTRQKAPLAWRGLLCSFEHRRYEGCIDGHEELNNKKIEAAMGWRGQDEPTKRG